MLKGEDISVSLRLSTKADSKVKAHADVLLPLDGVIELSGFAVIQSNGGSPWVVPPSRKGQDRYFDIVVLHGKIKTLVEEAVLAEFTRQAKTARSRNS